MRATKPAVRGERSEGAAEGGPARWGVILAGGDGTRLRPLTERITGDARPKQFCPVLGSSTLLDETRRRVGLGISPHRTLVVVTRAHERFYAPLLADLWSRQLVVQPTNRGTGPAILYALLRLAPMAWTDPVALFPSDHDVADEAAFVADVGAAFDIVAAWPEVIVGVGVRPHRQPEESGWIVARVAALLELIKRAAPDLYQAFAPVRSHLHTRQEAPAIEALYASLPSIDFSREVLASPAATLAVLPAREVGWNDLGTPDRIPATRRQLAPAASAVGVA